MKKDLLIGFSTLLISSLIFYLAVFGSQKTNRDVSVKDVFPDKEWSILYFGFVGCSGPCPLTLSNLSEIYGSLSKDEQQKIGVLFVNLTDESQSDADDYAKKFHPDFYSFPIKNDPSQNLKKLFGVIYKDDKDKEPSHSNHIYFVKKNQSSYTLKRVYNRYPADFDELKNIFQSLDVL